MHEFFYTIVASHDVSGCAIKPFPRTPKSNNGYDDPSGSKHLSEKLFEISLQRFQAFGYPWTGAELILWQFVRNSSKGTASGHDRVGRKTWKGFGYFEGFTPVMALSDPDILRNVLVKDFDNFKSRKPFPLAPRRALGLFLENGHQWKRSRTLLTPAFSTGKLKQMFNIMNSSVDFLVANLEKQCESGKPFDVYSKFQSLTLDVIGRCAFGLQTNAQTDPNDPFMTNIGILFNTLSKTIILPLCMLFPFLQYFIFFLKNLVIIFGSNPVVWLRDQMREIIKIRTDMGPNSNIVDLVQLMLFSTPRGDEKPLTGREIVAQSMTFLLAGYETSSAVLGYLGHLLAGNSHVQNRLIQEIDKRLGDGEIDYRMVQNMPYFEMVFNEVCRLYPTASLIVTRRASKTKHYNGVTIPAGMAVQANVWALHHDKDFWENPDTFDPERFSTDNKVNRKPYSFLPFGAGPRSCIGMRFAMVETKVAIARVLQKFKFKPVKTGENSLSLECRGAIVPKNGVQVILVNRKSPIHRDSQQS
ncbi:hypothetical protein ScPMuIL_003945 [Solemya velum]